MAALTQSEVLVYEQETGASLEATAPFGTKEIVVECPATADDTDTFTVDLSVYGITTLKYVKGWDHTTAFSVLVLTAPTTSVTGSTLTVTIGGATDNLKRTFLIGGV